MEPISAIHHHGVKNVTSLLEKRKEWGNMYRYRSSRHRSCRVTSTLLSSYGAWNSSRMNNMILAVGPGTPATALTTVGDDDSSSSSDSVSLMHAEEEKMEERDELNENEDVCEEQKQGAEEEVKVGDGDDNEDEDGDDASERQREVRNRVRRALRSRWLRVEMRSRTRGRSASFDDDDSNDDELQLFSVTMGGADQNSDEDENSHMNISGRRQQGESGNKASSMRHGGCINTAAWMTCPWRLSLTSHDSSFGILSSSHSSNNDSMARYVATDDCPTQLITSGDDRVVKFWDARYAIGTANPLAGGMNTICPFSAPTIPCPQTAFKEWREYYKNRPPESLASGMVVPLATLSTGHRGNVFHATPISGHPGKVATCAADGYLRVADIESPSAASIVISPEFDPDDTRGGLPAGLLSLRPGMCFSHHFLNDSVGLLCSERGLRRFDIRLSPREQRTRSILGGPYQSCKSCAIWSADSRSLDDVDSAYVFAGGSSGNVSLYDLRMTDDSGSKIVQKYRPTGLAADSSASVSGLDLSRDRRELLVSYESDQIYTFPVFPHASSAAGPSVDELNDCSKPLDDTEGDTEVLPELACYGGHLNRLTFLKSAKYAGPNDQYICTGSDSGNAWIYERATGAVAALLNADHSTCNGVVPHPSLPCFLTYGIDSTAKLWRATGPVDRNVDDSPVGRARCYNMLNYEKSPAVQSWNNVQTSLMSLSDNEDESAIILPDEIPSRDEELECSIFDSLGSIFFRRRRSGPHGPGGSYIGNNLRNLPEILRQNLFSCVRAREHNDDEPVKSDLEELRRRMSTIRLRHQADSRGLQWDSTLPWIMHPKDSYLICDDKRSSQSEIQKARDKDAMDYGDAVDLVPDRPSDWIPYDIDMSRTPKDCGTNFNVEQYETFFAEQYNMALISLKGTSNDRQTWIATSANGSEDSHEFNGFRLDTTSESKEEDEQRENVSHSPNEERFNKRAWKLLHDTVQLLKEHGNAAMLAGQPAMAARRYDKAIQYCAVAFMTFPAGILKFLKTQEASAMGTCGHDLRWFPLLKLLINTRLNLALAMLKPQLNDASGAIEQSQQALAELRPFAQEKGKVIMGPKDDAVRPGDEPIESFREAKDLQAKAYFRLGTAQFTKKDFAAAVKSFEHSIKSTKEATRESPVDATVIHRLAQAKREMEKQKKRHRKKFKRMFAKDEAEERKEANEHEAPHQDD